MSIPLPTCLVHGTTHPPLLCHTEIVWHPVVCKPQPKAKALTSPGMHLGKILDPELRARRRAKNARNLARNGQDRAPGSAKRVKGRLHLRGNRQQRGVGF